MIQRENGRQLMIIGIIVIIVVLLLFFVLQNRGGGSSTGSATAEKSTPVVVALQTIPQGTTFRAGQPLTTYFGVKNFPASLVPFGAYSSVKQVANVATSAGCQNNAACAGTITTTQTIYQSVPIVSGMFSTLGQYRQTQTPSFNIPLGFVGIAISLSDVNSVLNSIEAGDNIDLIGSYTGGGHGINTSTPPQTQYLFNNLKVISVGGPPANPSATGTGTPSAGGGTLLVLAKLQEALVIQHLKDFGWQLSAVLPSAKEPSIPHFRTLPVTDKWLFVKMANPFRTNPGY
jgi:Flp pilus assembly protein CpaB